MELSGSPRGERGPAGHVAATTTADRARERLDADESGFTGIGLPADAGWYVSAALYWIGGLAVVLIDQLSSNGVIDPAIAVLGTIELATAPLLLLGARFAPDAAWGAPVRILLPSIVLVVGGFFVGGAISALVLLLLFPVLAVAYMVSIPYCSAALVCMNAMLLAHMSSDPRVARAIVLTGVATALVTGLVFSQSRLRQELQRSTRDKSEIVIYAIGLDDFKQVNDRYSHSMGDALLIETARASESVAREDELVVRAPNLRTDMDSLAARISEAILGARIRLTLDIIAGATVVTVFRDEHEDAPQFMQRADEALREAKTRERVKAST
ncbi:MAG: GGDEF domain-containing protein [Solirubrobacterales bacterium]